MAQRECPDCGLPDVFILDDGTIEKHRQPVEDLHALPPWCRRGGFPYLPSEGWLVLVGNGYPIRVDEPEIDEMSVLAFPDEAGARRWIEEHPKAKGAYPIEMKGQA